MKTLTLAGMVSAGAAAVMIGFSAPAVAAPTAIADAQPTISSLRDQGYTVVVHNPNMVPLDEASVVSVRQGPEMVNGTRDHTDGWNPTVTQSIVFVDVK